MFVPCVIWALCLLSIIEKMGARRKRYFCDTWEDAKQASVYDDYYPPRIALFARSRRLVGTATEIWFIFNNRTFYTGRILVDELADEDLGPTSFLLGDIYFDDIEVQRPNSHKCFAPPREGPYDEKCIPFFLAGHFYRFDRVFEFYKFYRNMKTFNDMKKYPEISTDREFFLNYYFQRLEFGDGQVWRDPTLIDFEKFRRSDEKFEMEKQELEFIVTWNGKLQLNKAVVIETDDMKLAFGNALGRVFGKYHEQFESHLSLAIQYIPKGGRFKNKLFNYEFGGLNAPKEQKRADHLLHGYLLKVDEEEPANFDLFVMEFYPDEFLTFPRPRIRLGHFTFRDQKATEWTVKVTWDQLLSCHTWDAEEMRTEARGVYYDKKSKTFYVFIKRFYLLYTEDLVKTGFHLGVYKTNTTYLRKERYFGDRAIDIKLQSGLKWDLGPRMYVKNFANRAYLTPGLANFVIEIEHDGKLVFKRYEKGEMSTIRFCFRQTFQLDQYVYCFDEKDYRLIYKPDSEVEPRKIKRTPIARVFQIAPFEWKDWPIKIIFNYEENLVVFLSYEFLFVFSYKNFRRHSDDTLYFEQLDNHVSLMGDNCLFNSYCNIENVKMRPIALKPTEFPPSTTKKLTTTPKPTTKMTTTTTTTTTTTPKPTTKKTTTTPRPTSTTSKTTTTTSRPTTTTTSGPTTPGHTTESKMTTRKQPTTAESLKTSSSTGQPTDESENPTGVTGEPDRSSGSSSDRESETVPIRVRDSSSWKSKIQQLLKRYKLFLLAGLILFLLNILLCSFYATTKKRRSDRRPTSRWPRTSHVPFFWKRRPKIKKIEPLAGFEPRPRKAPPESSRKHTVAKEKKRLKKSPPKQTKIESPTKTIDSSNKSSASKSITSDRSKSISSDRSKRSSSGLKGSDTPRSSNKKSFVIPKKFI